jgi:hypothetical protein
LEPGAAVKIVPTLLVIAQGFAISGPGGARSGKTLNQSSIASTPKLKMRRPVKATLCVPGFVQSMHTSEAERRVIEGAACFTMCTWRKSFVLL